MKINYAGGCDVEMVGQMDTDFSDMPNELRPNVKRTRVEDMPNGEKRVTVTFSSARVAALTAVAMKAMDLYESGAN